MSESKLSKEALDYHNLPIPGKIEVVSTKPCKTQQDLSLAYTPGVAVPCLKIEEDAENAYKYTSKGNLVAVLTNGTAVLGLGNIGAIAGKPVMEGKGILFKSFADIDVFDIEVDTKNSDELIKTCQLLEPTFGGINLEDIKAPECFYIEEELKKTMKIPVFHDDQHGTAIVAGAALLNGLIIIGKKIEEIKVVINGAGASGLAIAGLFVSLGVKKENLTVCDTKGIIYKGRAEGMNKYKENFALDTDKRTLSQAVDGADVLFGLSTKGAFTEDMIKSMADNPIIMAMANPDPEITPEEVKKIRPDALMATGRSDYPNQVNNVLCFPFIFRGALDVRATAINEEMKKAAAYAIAELARQSVPESVCKAYGVQKLEFGKEYIIPKPFDPRVFTKVSIAVAKAAMDSGVATKPIKDFGEYKRNLEERLNPEKYFYNTAINKIKNKNINVGFSNGNEPAVISAACLFAENTSCKATLIGNISDIKATAKNMALDISNIDIIEKDNNLPIDLLSSGKINALIVIAGSDYNQTISHITKEINNDDKVSTCLLLANRNSKLLITDTLLNSDNNMKAKQVEDTAKFFNIEPKISIVNGSNFDIDNKNILVFSSLDIANSVGNTLIITNAYKKAATITQGFTLPIQVAEKDCDSDTLVTLAAIAAANVK